GRLARRFDLWRSRLALPAPELCRRFIKAARPSDQIFHAAGCKQRAIGLEPVNSKVFRIGNDTFAPKLRRLGRLGLEANRADTRHRSECPATLLSSLSLVKVGDAFFRDDVAHVIPVDHDRSEWHSCSLADLDRIQRLDECRNTASCKCLQRLHHDLAAPSRRIGNSLQIKPCGTGVPAAMRVASHIRSTSEPGKSSGYYRGGIGISIH